MAERIDLLGRHYHVFIKECRRNRVFDNLPAHQIPVFMRDIMFYINDKMRGDNLPVNLKIKRAIEHNSRY